MCPSPAPSEREQELSHRYGEILTLADIAKVLRFPSTQAVLKARGRGRLPIQLVKLPNRRGWFATARSVAKLLDNLDSVEGGAK